VPTDCAPLLAVPPRGEGWAGHLPIAGLWAGKSSDQRPGGRIEIVRQQVKSGKRDRSNYLTGGVKKDEKKRRNLVKSSKVPYFSEERGRGRSERKKE